VPGQFGRSLLEVRPDVYREVGGLVDSNSPVKFLGHSPAGEQREDPDSFGNPVGVNDSTHCCAARVGNVPVAKGQLSTVVASP